MLSASVLLLWVPGTDRSSSQPPGSDLNHDYRPSDEPLTDASPYRCTMSAEKIGQVKDREEKKGFYTIYHCGQLSSLSNEHSDKR